jgi:dTMP kinase
MIKHNYPGKFIVIEGIDGAGKNTQTKLLVEALHQKGFAVEKVDFPQYTKASAGMIENYLKGSYGSSEEVGPYRASIFYACDRYDMSFKIKQWLQEGKIVISDRYVASNIGHQGGKLINNRESWDNYIDWLYDLEYNIFQILKPDATLILKISPELSMKMSNQITDIEKKNKRDAYLGDSKKQDIHEADKNHLKNTLESYLTILKKHPEEYHIIECEEKGKFLPKEVIGEKILEIILNAL